MDQFKSLIDRIESIFARAKTFAAIRWFYCNGFKTQSQFIDAHYCNLWYNKMQDLCWLKFSQVVKQKPKRWQKQLFKESLRPMQCHWTVCKLWCGLFWNSPFFSCGKSTELTPPSSKSSYHAAEDSVYISAADKLLL